METILLFLDVINWLAVLAYTAVALKVICILLPLRQYLGWKLLAVFPFFLLATVVVYLNDPFNLVFSLLGFILYVFLFHQGGWSKKAAGILIFYPLVIAVNFLQQNLFSDLFFAVSHAPSPRSDESGVIINWSRQMYLLSSGFWTLSQVVRLLFWVGMLLFLRRYKEQITSEKIEEKTWLLADALMLVSTVAVLTAICFISSDNAIVYPLCVVAIIASLGGVTLVAYMSRSEQTAREAQRLLQQHAYYEEKLKEEERVRSVYHDMKNHLLVLEHADAGARAKEAAGKLQEQLAAYEDYVHTGNGILDIILKEKAADAREKQIDFSAAADLHGMDFLEPLDISTIFGNGLDNAIEASEKLPEGQRVILVKAGRVQDFLSILIENTCPADRETKKGRTSKKDDFFHGFGISNMQKAAGKYGGHLNAGCAEGRFSLKILIPIP